jgi:AraC family transcriptional regulator, regulatory protein of adaptative response / methylated-DNA-[protein]-cysteine methyltransferase
MNMIARDMAKAPQFGSNEARWQAVIDRDCRADGAFYYSVRTTGIYCRPSCAARRPRRENVEFHATCDEAERAGFRPCMRCRPNLAAANEHGEVVARACRLIAQAEEMPRLTELAASAGLSPFHFHRVFKAITGLTPKSYASAYRAKRLVEALPGANTVTQAIYEAGFNSSGRFYEASQNLLGMTPTRYRSGGRDIVIRFAVGECSLGSILVASTEKGVCAILFGDEPEALVRDIQDRFPKAKLVGGDREFEELIAKVVGFVEEPGVGFDLPLDVRGTAFQQRVWQALRKIPAGSKATYGDIARSIGSSKAIRAVAQACASNKIAVAIPCHRIVRQDGALGGYQWGIDRKRALLDREAAA